MTNVLKRLLWLQGLWRKPKLEMRRQIRKLVHELQQEVKVAWTRVTIVGLKRRGDL